jgi:ATP-binding cassette subfamily A (ABC1) protein 3
VTGICPQHDILFDTVSVKEHLSIYCDFKGVPQDQKQSKIEKVIADVGLSAYEDTLAINLSGGNRRKLSVALALVTDSRLVLLDEPTSGMDLTARRRLWDMLKEYKKDRIIILTTHNMDEADILGDRIGIMSKGRIVCDGSGVFLKSRYGCGYTLGIKKQHEIETESTVSSYL